MMNLETDFSFGRKFNERPCRAAAAAGVNVAALLSFYYHYW